MVYYNSVKEIKWNASKSALLKQTRGASFEDILRSRFIGLYEHHKRKNQFILLYEYNNYIWVVPCIIRKTTLFLKTLYPSRKFTRKYRKGEAQ